ncbi:MAG: hypothetical protein MUF75_10110 [Bacteroidia bacterium]|nr:hypothetical protein [Bacteroidia bacterium]
MKNVNKIRLLKLFFVLAIAACKKDDPDPAPAPAPIPGPACYATKIDVVDDIDVPTVWKACTVYVVSVNQISVKSTLTIEPGAIVKFKENVFDNAIQVSASGKIYAVGNASNPVIFTSYKDDSRGGDSNGDGNATSPARFDWGGIIINSNTCEFRYCHFYYGGEGPSPGAAQPSLEFSMFYGTVDHCTFAYCGGDTTYNGYGVVDARSSENPNLVITNCTFYGNIKPLFLNPHNSLDNSNVFHNPANPSEKNRLNGVFMTSTSNEATTNVSWLETEVPFVLTGSTFVGDGLKLTLAENVIIKVALLPATGFNKLSIKEGSSFIEGYNLPGVFFTSYRDDAHGGDTNGDGNATSAAPGDWYGVQDISSTLSTNNSCYPWPNILYAVYP